MRIRPLIKKIRRLPSMMSLNSVKKAYKKAKPIIDKLPSKVRNSPEFKLGRVPEDYSKKYPKRTKIIQRYLDARTNRGSPKIGMHNEKTGKVWGSPNPTIVSNLRAIAAGNKARKRVRIQSRLNSKAI
jgi:hypothetical protein